MQWRVILANAVVFSAMGAMALSGTRKDTAQVLPALSANTEISVADLSGLERDVAKYPSTQNVGALATAYLERNQPGLASAVLENAPKAIQQSPEIAYLSARSSFLRGKVSQALAAAEQVKLACGDAVQQRCPAWLVAKTERQLAFFREMNALGIENPYENPELTRAAYERSSHELRTVAMR